MNIDFKFISSVHNPQVLLCKSLENARERKKKGLFIIEGLREVQHAAEGGYVFHSLSFPVSGMNKDEIYAFITQHQLKAEQYYLMENKAFARMAYREDSKNVVALAYMKKLQLNQLILGNNPLILILENIEKPGNIGALLRTCDAAGVSAVIVTGNQTDIYNPNIVRASLGALFTNQVALCENHELIELLSEKQIQILVTTPAGDKTYTMVDFTRPTAVVMGSEAFGISSFWLDDKFEKIVIPMSGKVDSLNVSVSAGIILYEAVRQRGVNTIFQ